MNEPPLAPHLRAYALNFAARLAPMLRALARLAGYRFARNPILAPFLALLQQRLCNAARRMSRLMASLAAGDAPRPTRARPARRLPPPPPRPRLPAGRGWLIRALPNEAVNIRTQLAALLGEPEIAEIVALCRRARRILAPIGHALSDAQPRALPRRALIPWCPAPLTGTPPTAIPAFLLYPEPPPPRLAPKAMPA